MCLFLALWEVSSRVGGEVFTSHPHSSTPSLSSVSDERLVGSSSSLSLPEIGRRLRALLDDSLAEAAQTGKGGRVRPKFAPAVDDSARTLPLSLSSILKPFEQSLTPPLVRFTGDAGTPIDAVDLPTSLDDVVNKLLYSHERRSAVLRLEHLVEQKSMIGSRFNASTMIGPLHDILVPFLPLGSRKGETTGHVYISNADASALENHTDITEILVVQLLGQKEWRYCSAEESDFFDDDSQPIPEWLIPKTTLPAKLSKCTTYSAIEMADNSLKCELVVTAPGDMLFLPRRTVHSARTVPGGMSVHLTIGVTTGINLPSPDRLNVRRRLESCATGCDESCDPSCDESGCDGTGCDGAGCDASVCAGSGCDGSGCGMFVRVIAPSPIIYYPDPTIF
jgi:hypothetical protein